MFAPAQPGFMDGPNGIEGLINATGLIKGLPKKHNTIECMGVTTFIMTGYEKVRWWTKNIIIRYVIMPYYRGR